MKRLFGKDPNPFLLTFLYTITFIGIVVLICVKDKLPDNFLVGLVGLLGVLIGQYRKPSTRDEK